MLLDIQLLSWGRLRSHLPVELRRNWLPVVCVYLYLSCHWMSNYQDGGGFPLARLTFFCVSVLSQELDFQRHIYWSCFVFKERNGCWFCWYRRNVVDRHCLNVLIWLVFCEVTTMSFTVFKDWERKKKHLYNFLFEIHSRFEGVKKFKPSFMLYQLTFGLDR